MDPIFFEILKDIIPFDISQLVKPNSFEIITVDSIDTDDLFVHKQHYEIEEILNEDFKNWLLDREVIPRRVLVWHWLCANPDIAHIDCNSEGEIPTAALNWTINDNKNQVQFYNIPDVKKEVVYGNQADVNWKMDNVTAYIPINVKGLKPAAIWNTRGPALLNIAEPHLIVAPEMRTAVSLQFHREESFEVILGKIRYGRYYC